MSTVPQPGIMRDEHHVYRVDGKIVPGVNKILQWAGMKDYSAIPNDRAVFAMDRGTAVHEGFTMLVDDNLDWSTVDERIVPRIQAAEKFLHVTGFKPELLKFVVHNEQFGYCGELDMTGHFPDRTKAVVDLKCTDAAIQPWVGLQLSFYQFALYAPLTYRRFALRLKSDGEYNAKEFPRSEAISDWNCCLAALNTVNWKMKHGYKLEGEE